MHQWFFQSKGRPRSSTFGARTRGENAWAGRPGALAALAAARGCGVGRCDGVEPRKLGGSDRGGAGELRLGREFSGRMMVELKLQIGGFLASVSQRRNEMFQVFVFSRLSRVGIIDDNATQTGV